MIDSPHLEVGVCSQTFTTQQIASRYKEEAMGWSKKVRENPWWFKFLAVLSMSMLLALPSYAQVAGATLSGTATDASGAAVPNVQIAIKNTGTGVVRTVPTDAADRKSVV
jgi:hypothetical protein